MNVYVWKYQAANNYIFSNYFNVSPNPPTLVDKIKVNEILMDGIPIYEERLEKQGDTLEFTAGDFDIRLSLLSSAISLHGHTLKDFLLPNGANNFFYICVMEFGDSFDPACKRIGGKIDLNSIEADLTVTQNRYEIQFKVTGILKELSDILSKMQLTSISASYTLEIFISSCLSPAPFPNYLNNSTRIIWDERIGYTPKLMYQVYNDVLNIANSNGGISKWTALKDLTKSLGFVLRADVLYRGDMYNLDYPCFSILTFWRSSAIADKQLQIISDVRRYSDWNTFKNYLIVTHRSNILGKDNEYEGMLATNDGSVFIADGIAGSVFEEMIFDKSTAVIMAVIDETPPLISSSSATVINLPTYTTNYRYIVENDSGTDLISHKVSLMSMFCRSYHVNGYDPNNRKWAYVHGFKQLMLNTIGQEYKYFISGIKKAASFEIVFDSNTKLNIYDTTTIDGVRYFCKAITNINLIEQTASTEWVQV